MRLDMLVRLQHREKGGIDARRMPRSSAAVLGARAQFSSMKPPDLNMKLFQAIWWMPPEV